MPLASDDAAIPSSASRPDAAIASAIVAPAASLIRRRNWRPGSAYATSTSIVSAIRLAGGADEVVDHAIGDTLKTEPERRAGEHAGILEIERERDLAAGVAERRERELAFERLQRAFDEMHVQSPRAQGGIARREALREAGEAQIKPRDAHVVGLARDDLRAGAPRKARRVCFDVVDEVEHRFGRILHQRVAADLDHGTESMRVMRG